jgi:hypothetical protein
MTPDLAWVVGSAIAAGPAYLMARLARQTESTKHAEGAHAETRQVMVDALNAVVGPLTGRLDEMHATLADVHEWQAQHSLEHSTEELKRIPALEIRKGS